MSIWTKEEIEYLKTNYNNYSTKELARLMNRTCNAIKIKANKIGIKRKEKYYYNKNYFKAINQPDQSYWLGFIYADGYVTTNKNKTKYSVGIELNENDYKHLQLFNKSINGNIKVCFRKRKSKYIGDRYVNETTNCQIRLYSSQMAKDLISHGCCLKKTLIKGEPNGIPDNLMRDFIRGYFDGNGSISYSYNKQVNKKYLKVTIESGSLTFIKWLSDYLNKRGYHNNFYPDSKNSYKIQIYSKRQKEFLDYIYKDSKEYLSRKYSLYRIAVYGENNASKP